MGPPAGFPMGGPPPPGLQMARPMPPPLVRKPPVIQQLVFEYGDIAPDNFVQKGILINQRFPGPPIRVQWLDTLIIDVTNNLDHGIALHFHGLRNYGESFSDGVPYITQEPIPPGGVFRYTINIGYQTGTFLYHLQSSVADQIWGFGPIIIEDGPELLANQPAYYHFWDHVLILSQCWHTAMSKLFKLEGPLNSEQAKYFKGFSSEPASILINGRSYGKWGKRNGLTEGYEVITVQPEKTYRLRVIGGGIDSILTFAIESHKMTIMEVDGTIIEPLEVDRLEVNSGQRYSILVTMDQEVGTYLITSEMIPGPGPNNGKAILQYEGAEVDVAKRTKVYKGNSTFEKLKRWEGSKLSPNPVIRQPDIYPLPKSVDREIVITMTRKKKTKEASDDDDDESEDDDKSDKKTKRDASPKSDDSHDTSYSYQG
ncbi:laccase-2 [Folsomia candida]|uniref:laccase-2 n=1 Tax=Folsomia candida TaxID=158441 RepID=UPI00160558A2|nr:laccase-2 [Folsomia candida]